MSENKKKISSDEIKNFIEGYDPMERIVNKTYSYQNDFVDVFYRDENDRKCKTQFPFYPFVWATKSACLKLCDGNREELKSLLNKYNIESPGSLYSKNVSLKQILHVMNDILTPALLLLLLLRKISNQNEY